jgi:hypothetical protein
LQADDEFPPPPPLRSGDSSLNDSQLNDSNSTTQSNVTSECSEAECDREPLVKDSRGTMNMQHCCQLRFLLSCRFQGVLIRIRKCWGFENVGDPNPRGKKKKKMTKNLPFCKKKNFLKQGKT